MQTMYITQRVTQLNLPPPLGRTALPLLDAVLKTKEEYIMQKRAARRGTRALAFLLCLLMVVSLLPVMGASAAEGDVTAEGVKLNKSLTLESDGTYTITLEAYATGTVTSTTVTEPVPTDFVLVLDQSGSMANNITSYTYTARDSQAYSYYSFYYSTYYYKDGDAYYEVQSNYAYSRGTSTYYLYYTKDNVTYYLSGSEVTTTRPTNVVDYDATIWTGVLYTRTASSQTKLAALKKAVNSFINSVETQAKGKDGIFGTADDISYRIAIVGFANGNNTDNKSHSNYGGEYYNTELFIGSTQYQYGSSTINDQYQYALQSFPAGKTNLTASVNALDDYGATYPNYGFKMANSIFDNRADKTYTKADGTTANRGTVVVMFTDGQPGYSSFENTVANATMQEAKLSKNTYNAKVFTIGVFDSETTNIRTFMNAVSSNYQPTVSQTPTMNNPGAEKPASDATNYYAKADDSEALNNAFQSVSSSVNSSSTSCVLDDESVLTDVISDNLDLPEGFNEGNVTVSTAPCTGKDENGNPIFGNASPFSANVSIDGKTKTVNVSGFDYSSHYVTGAANEGQKLIVTITGLLPNQDGTGMPSNETTSGIYDDGNLVAPFEVPTFDVASRNVVLDFSMTANIANVAGVKGNERVSTNTYGEFTYGSNDLTYTLGKRVESGNLVFDGIDSALYYGHAYGDDTAQNAWTKVNVIPANNVYFDDDLLNVTSDFNDDDYGYDAAVNNAAYDVEPVADSVSREFTFTGTGIDVYCTTENTSGWISAVLLNEDGSRAKDADGNNIKAIYMNNQYESEPNLINVPTISIQNVPYGKYVLHIETMSGTNYKLDGIRVYNPANTEKVDVNDAYEAAGEANAVFKEIRDILLVNGLGEYDNVTGAVYTDQVRDDSHTTNEVSVYEQVGPKNEVYLANGNGVAFKIDNYNGQHVMIGLSAPEAKENSVGIVTVPNGDNGATTIELNSAVDMYYEVTPTSDGYVFIKNTGDVLVSVSKLKVTGETGAVTLSVDDGLLSYVADFDTLSLSAPAVNPTPAPDTTPNQTTITATINAIWNRVMNGIAKLFGHI